MLEFVMSSAYMRKRNLAKLDRLVKVINESAMQSTQKRSY
jgi:hypothetical protein